MTTVRDWGLQPYAPILEAMRTFTRQRTPQTPDELWCLEHEPVYTQGQAGRAEHILDPKEIPVVQSCRGGQVTYHGPGQLIVYTLIDLRRQPGNPDIRWWIDNLEHAMIVCLASYGLQAHARKEAPGIYVGPHKIGSLGLRVRRGCCYHGISLNINMDLTPFQRIHPCGHIGLEMVQLSDFVPGVKLTEVQPRLLTLLQERLS